MIGLKDFDGKELTVNQTWDPVWVIRHFFSIAGEDLILQPSLADSATEAILLLCGKRARTPCAYYDVLQASGLQQNIDGCPQGYHKKKIRLRNLTSFNALLPLKFYLIHYET